MVISFIATWFKRLGAICLAFVILWHLTAHGAPTRGKVMVHLKSADKALVLIDQRSYPVESGAQAPVVCDLAPGRHVAQVWRHGFLEGEEAFMVEPGRVAIIGPLDRRVIRRRAAAADVVSPARRSGPAGLAAHLQPILDLPVTD
jgi:hypothetical protein